jgi:hypothetical protein
MGLIINKTDEKTITIQGTTIEMDNVYGRIEFAGRADGKTLEIAVTTYASYQAFTSGAAAFSTDVQMGSFTVELQPTEVQSIDTALQYASSAYTQQGYVVQVQI